MNNVNLQDLLSSISVEADWIGLRKVKEATTHRYIRDGQPQANSRDVTHGLMVEVLVNGQFGYYGINSFDPKSVSIAAEKAQLQAKLASKHAIYKFDEKARPSFQGEYTSPREKPLNSISPSDLNTLLFQINNALKVSNEVISVSALARIVETEQEIVSSNGSDINQDFNLITFDMSATASDGTIFQTRTNAGSRGYSRQVGSEVFEKTDEIIRAARTIGEEAVELIKSEECPTEVMDLVLAPDQMMLQIHESVGHATEIDRILGDERNYAGWSFVQLSDFGSLRYGSDLMNITFDPTMLGEFASYGYDDGGLKAEKEYIIKDGILLRGLGGMESQLRTGLPGVANFRASAWNRAPIDRMANLNLEYGESSFEEIISSIKRGVYMKSNRSWSIDDYRNKFQFGCEYGQMIENGKLTKILRNPNYRGISKTFWNNLKMVGDKDTFGMYGTPYCGKGEPNQIIRVGHASPVALFKNVEIFGGA